MKLKHRALTLLLTIAMLLTFMPAMAFAAPDKDVAKRIEIKSFAENGLPDEDAGTDWYVGNDYDEVELVGGTAELTVCLKDTKTGYDFEAPEGTTYQWYVGEWSGDDEDGYYYYNEIEEANGNSLTVTETGRYACAVIIDGATQIGHFDVYSDEDGDDEYDFGDLPDDKDIDEIELNKIVDVNVDQDAPIKTFKFTPNVSGVYAFESLGDSDTVGQVRTEERVIDINDDKEYHDENDYNFFVIFYADKETTYYLQAKEFYGKNTSFRVRLCDYPWYAYAEEDDLTFNGDPVELKVAFVGDIEPENAEFSWFDKNGKQIRGVGGKSIHLSKGGKYTCQIRTKDMEQNIFFFVDLDSEEKDGLRFIYYLDSDTAGVRAAYDDNDNCLARGNVTIPASYKFKDGDSRKVTIIRYGGFDGATGMTSVSIPSTVTEIKEDAFINTGLKSVQIPASVSEIEDHAFGFTGKYIPEGDDDEGEYVYTAVPGFVIFGKTGSEAQRYAKKYNITFRDPDAEARAREAAKAAASNINKATVSAADIKKASDLGATSVTLGASVKKIQKNAFKGTNITYVEVKTKKLKAKSVKGSLKGSRVSTIKVNIGKKKVNKQYVKKYKKIFTKKNAGKKAKVK